MEVGIYNFSLQKRLESLKVAPISDRNKKLLLDFMDYCFTKRLGQHRILKKFYKWYYKDESPDLTRLTEAQKKEVMAMKWRRKPSSRLVQNVMRGMILAKLVYMVTNPYSPNKTWRT